MRATKFEFEKRFWIICAIFAVGFSLSYFDHAGFATAVRHLVAPSILPGSPDRSSKVQTLGQRKGQLEQKVQSL